MAVQIQLRRGTASAWTSANPTLAIGEFAIETDTDLYKIGDGSTAWTSLGYSSLPSNAIASTGGTFTGAVTFNGASPLVFEGATADAHETTITITDPTADRTITFPNETGTVVTTAGGTFTGAVTIPDLTVTGTTTTFSTTNTVIADSLMELNTGASSNANDLGIVMERGSTGDNAIIAWDESADKFTMGTTTATGASTGNLTITAGTLVANLEGAVTGAVTGNASTATALANARTIGGTSFDGTANITPANATLAATATALATARTIGGVSFDGTANIALPGVNAAGNQNTSGTAATVTGAAQAAITSVGILTSLTVSGGLVAPLQINAQTGTTYTFVIGDAGKLVTSSNGSAQTFTVPPNSSVAFTVGTQIMVQNIGSANCTLAQGSGVTIQSKDSAKAIDGQFSAATLIKTATDTWSLIGALA